MKDIIFNYEERKTLNSKKKMNIKGKEEREGGSEENQKKR